MISPLVPSEGVFMLQRLFIIVLLAPLGGCPDSQTIQVEDPNVVCEEGDSQPCSCALGVMGTQVCQEGGFFELCQCDNENQPNDNSNNNSNNNSNTTGDAGVAENTGPTPPPCQDADGDGFYNCIPEGAHTGDGGTIPEELDCDDSMWHVQPGGAEVARNGIDDNCNGEIDEVENGCTCLSGNTHSPEALASSMGLCGDGLLDTYTMGKIRQRNAQAGYFGVAPRAGSCLAVLSSGKAIPGNNSEGSSTLYLVSNDSNATFECKVNSDAWASCDGDYTLPAFTNGIQKIQFRALDAAGNKDPAPLIYQWDAATHEVIAAEPGGEAPASPAPALELVSPADGDNLSDSTPYMAGYAPQGNTVTVTITNTSNDFSFDLVTQPGATGRWAIPEASWSGQLLLEGTYTLTTSTSSSGSLAPITINVLGDGETPAYTDATISHVENIGTNSALLHFTGANEASFECRVDAEAWESCSSPHSFLALDDTPHTFYVRAILSGATEPVPDEIVWQAANTDLMLLNPAEGSTTTEALPAFIGRGMPGLPVQLTLQQIEDGNVTNAWAQSVMVAPDGRFAAIFPPLTSVGTFRINYSMPDLSEDVSTVTFTRTQNGSDTVAPGTFLGGHKDVQSGTNFNSSGTDPDPNPEDGNHGGYGSGYDSDYVYDLAQLSIEVKKPSNVEGFAFDFMFLSSEFPEYLCQIYNDTFYALVTTTSLGADPVNVSFDANDNEITVNNAFFEPANQWTTPLQLTPFGAHETYATCPYTPGSNWEDLFDDMLGADECTLPDYCSEPEAVNTVGSGSGWLTTTVPLASTDDTVKITFSVHDEGDGQLDSLVLIDHFRWVVDAEDVSTEKPPELITHP